MSDILTPDICVVGAGPGGLAVAVNAAQMGASTVLVERGLMGGSYLNHGCIPSNALIAAARRTHQVAGADAFGVAIEPASIDYGRVHEHMGEVIAALAPNDSVARLEALGVNVIGGDARFTDARTLVVGDVTIRARRFVLATGARAAIPVIPGLSSAPYLTNEMLFDLTECPTHLMIVGGGRIGVEMAQAYVRLGARVTLIEAERILSDDDPELVDIIRTRLHREGVEVIEGVNVAEVERGSEGIRITIDTGNQYYWIDGSHVLVAAGRVPNVEDLDLEKAAIKAGPRGIIVDRNLRTSNKRVFAIGDVTGGPQFVNVARHHAGIVIRNALFRLSARADTSVFPHVTHTDPELAHVGATEAMAREQFGRITLLRWTLAENELAMAEREHEGLIKIILDKKGIIRGASIAAPRAGELIAPWVIAVSRRMRIEEMASTIFPGPSMSEISQRAADAYYTSTLYGPRTRAMVRFLSRFG